MKIQRILGCIALTLAVSVATADEPTTISGVKILTIRDDSPQLPDTDECARTRAARLICIEALSGKLSDAGFTVQDNADGADAELRAVMNFRWGNEVEVSNSIRISSLPGGHLLFSFVGSRTNTLASACNGVAGEAVKKILRSNAG